MSPFSLPRSSGHPSCCVCWSSWCLKDGDGRDDHFEDETEMGSSYMASALDRGPMSGGGDKAEIM